MLAGISHAQKPADRVALVIGNGAYKSSPLGNPVNDATDVAASLRKLGFNVILRTNPNIVFYSLAPIPIGWLIVYFAMWTIRWVRGGFKSESGN